MKATIQLAPTGLAGIPLLLAAPQDLVLDLNTDPAPVAGSQPGGFSEVGSALYFAARTFERGRELWILDSQGVSLVADIVPGAWDSAPDEIVDSGAGFAFFTAQTPATGRELWRSDGTAAGTSLVADVYPGPLGIHSDWPGSGYSPGSHDEIVVLGGSAYFLAADGASGVELWRSDGTAAGTAMVTDLAPGAATPEIEDLTVAGGWVYFTAPHPATPGERSLWRTDGTAAGTATLPPTGDADPSGLFAVGDRLFFVASTAAEGRELWVTDGTAAGTQLAVDLAPGADSAGLLPLAAIQGELWFSAYHDAVDGLWRTDGTAAGTVLVSALSEDIAYAVGYRSVVDLGIDVIFYHRDASTTTGIWRVGPVPGSETLIVDQDTVDSTELRSAGGLAYFVGPDPEGNLWVCNGNTAQEVANLHPGGTDIYALTDTADFNGLLVFKAFDGGPVGDEPWVTNGVVITPLADLNSEGETASSYLETMASTGDRALFVVPFENTLWRTDGTPAGTEPLLELDPGSLAYFDGPLTSVGGRVAFETWEIGFGQTQWLSDGTPEGTVAVLESEAANASWLGATGGRVVFANNLYAHDIYATAGAAGDAELIAQNLRTGDSAEFLGEVWFAGYDGDWHLWRSDGTATGTKVGIVTVPGAEGLQPTDLTLTGGLLYFVVKDLATGGRQVWVTDGTQAGTVLAGTLPPSSLTNHLRSPVGLDGTLYFVALQDGLGAELWKADLGGASLVADLLPGPGDGLLNSELALTAVGDRVVFWGDDGTQQGFFAYEPSSGAVARIDPGFLGFEKGPLHVLGSGDHAVLTNSTTSGSEGWVTDGTDVGTLPLFDLFAGPGSSKPTAYTRAGDKVVFFGDDGVHGTELFSIPFAATGDWAVDVFGQGCAGSSLPAPAIGSDGPATAGNLLDVSGAGALPGAFGVLLYGLGGPSVSFGPGCDLLTGLPSYVIGVAAADGNGDASLPLLMPSNPAFFGIPVQLQWLFQDTGGAVGGVGSATEGLRVLVGP